MKKTVSFAALIVIAITCLTAEEGMFTPDRIEDLRLEEKGLEIPVENLFNPGKDGLQEAIILMGGGTSEFVSSIGLILTNHHVAYGAVSAVSTPDSNYIDNGFIAQSIQDEIPLEDIDAKILRYFENVSGDALKGVRDKDNEDDRKDKIEKNIRKIVEKAEKKNKDLEFEVKPYYDGNRFYLEGYFVINDLRIVFVPPLNVGFYGGDTDNWMWPRHTGDFAFLRAYVDSECKGSEYSEDNVPYRPEKWLNTSIEGVDKDDFVFIMGYPAMTDRYRSSFDLYFEYEHYMPFAAELMSDRLAVLETAGKLDPELRLRFAQDVQDYNNTLKNYNGKLEGIRKRDLIEQKKQQEEAFEQWIAENESREKRFGFILAEIEQTYVQLNDLADLEYAIIGFQQTEMVDVAFEVMKYAGRAGIDVDDINTKLKEMIDELFMPLQVANYNLAWKQAAKLRGDNRIKMVENYLIDVPDEMRKDTALSYAEGAFEFSRENGILNDEKRKELLKQRGNSLFDSGDLFLASAEMLMTLIPEFLSRKQDLSTGLDRLHRKLTEAYMEYFRETGRILYPDANRGFRLSYGYVEGYSPRDAVYYLPFSSLKGVVEKDTGIEPFDMPERLRETFDLRKYMKWADSETGKMPVNFLSSLDSTGGNSGSPVLNAKGELVGVLFDGVYEAMTSDFMYESEITRSISVDIRYVLMIAEQWGAGFILDEMNILEN